MKILFGYLTQQYRGGTKFQLDFAENFDHTEVGFVTSNQHVDYEDRVKQIGKIHVIPPTKKIFKRIKALKELAEEYDVLYLNKAALNPIEQFIIKRAHFKKTVYHSHSTCKESKNPVIKWAYTFVHRISRVSVAKSADKLYACSNEAGIWLFGKKNRDKFTVVNNGIDVEKYRFNHETRQRLREELGLKGKTLLHVGAFVPVKNHTYLVEAFSELKNCVPDSELLLVGDGELKGEVQSKVEQLGISDSVHFLGYRNDVDSIMQAADIFVLPSVFEGLPFVVLEAQAAGLPCVVTDKVSPIAKVTEFYTEIDTSSSPKVFAEILAEYLNPERVDTADTLIKAGFDLKTCARNLENEIENLFERN